jgi:PIN domain nuclease of toxin-antitoxin system
MKVLLDSGVWWKYALHLPFKKSLSDFLAGPDIEWWLSPFSVVEMLYKVEHRKLPAPTHKGWLDEAVAGYRVAPFSMAAGIKAGRWEWEHGDPVDRCLAAIALTEGLTLIHTDTVLRDLHGFPHKYFPA